MTLALNGLLIDKRAALQRLLDLYLSGEFQKDLLIDKKVKLERAIAGLEKKQTTLLASLGARSISDEDELTLMDFAGRISVGLENADACFKSRRRIIEALKVEAILTQEDSKKTLRIKCVLGEGYFALSPALSVVLSFPT